MRSRIAFVAVATALLAMLPLLGGGAPTAQANYCEDSTFPPTFPPPAQGDDAELHILGGYNHIGAAQNFSGYGCVNGEMVHDTRWIPPRAHFVRVYLVAKCTPGETFTGGTLRGLGVNVSSLTLTCNPPGSGGRTSAVTGPHYIRSNVAGRITASFTFNGQELTTASHTVVPLSQPA